MPRILNLTQHDASAEQLAGGVYEAADRIAISRLLTFDTCPEGSLVRERASALAAIAIAEGCNAAMIGGAPWLMAPLEAALRACAVAPVYAFSVRDVTETKLGDGSMRKTQMFRHAGWIWA
jgi:hypothetical protein